MSDEVLARLCDGYEAALVENPDIEYFQIHRHALAYTLNFVRDHLRKLGADRCIWLACSPELPGTSRRTPLAVFVGRYPEDGLRKPDEFYATLKPIKDAGYSIEVIGPLLFSNQEDVF